MGTLLALLPWIGFGVLAALRLREPLTLGDSGPPSPAPFVSVVIPARDEAQNIGACVRSLAASSYPGFEIIVVDDRSEDDTGAIVQALAAGNATDIRLVQGQALPEGWFGKPWACWQGAEIAKGELILFTDADTVHGPALLLHAVGDLFRSGASALSLVGDQTMETFWERVVQPQMFFLIALRYPNPRRLYRTPLKGKERWPDAIANGQYILFKKTAYAVVGGHRAVREEVVEDLRLAQHLVREGQGLLLRDARGRFSTRMYRSLRELVEGWSKNVWIGSRQSVRGPGGALLLPSGILALLVLWVLPPVVLAATLGGWIGGAVLPWAAAATGVGVSFWSVGSARFGAPWYYGFAAPIGAFATCFILARSLIRGRRIEWKGRRYESA